MNCDLLPSDTILLREQIPGLPTTSLGHVVTGRSGTQISRKGLVPNPDEFTPSLIELSNARSSQGFSLEPAAELYRNETVPSYPRLSTIKSENLSFAVCRGNSWQTASAPWEIGPLTASVQPKEIIENSARPLVTDRVQKILNGLIKLINLEAHRNFMPVSRIEVSGFVDREEGIEEIVVTQWVKVSPRSALDYWDRLSAIIRVWFSSLPDELANIAAERFSIEVRWEHHAATI